MSLTLSQRIVDATINSRWPLCRPMYYETSDLSNRKAESDLLEFGGIYLVWGRRKEPASARNLWVTARRGAAAVRHQLLSF